MCIRDRYCLHVLSAQWVGVWASVIGAAVIAYGWLTVFKRGPLESIVRRLTAVVGKENNEKVGV